MHRACNTEPLQRHRQVTSSFYDVTTADCDRPPPRSGGPWLWLSTKSCIVPPCRSADLTISYATWGTKWLRRLFDPATATWKACYLGASERVAACRLFAIAVWYTREAIRVMNGTHAIRSCSLLIVKPSSSFVRLRLQSSPIDRL